MKRDYLTVNLLISLTGVGMGIVNADYDYNLARKIGAYRWPSIFGIVNEQVISYGENNIGKENMKDFLRKILPADLITTVSVFFFPFQDFVEFSY